MAVVFRNLDPFAKKDITHRLAEQLIDPSETVRQSRFLKAYSPANTPYIATCFIEATRALEEKKFGLALVLAVEGKHALEGSDQPDLLLNIYFIFIKAVCSMHCGNAFDTLSHLCIAYMSNKLPQNTLAWVQMQKIRIFLNKDPSVFEPLSAFENAKNSLQSHPSHPHAFELKIIQTLALNHLERYEEARKALSSAKKSDRNHRMLASIEISLPYLRFEEASPSLPKS